MVWINISKYSKYFTTHKIKLNHQTWGLGGGEDPEVECKQKQMNLSVY